MSEIVTSAMEQMKRSLGLEFSRMEDDFDRTRHDRSTLADKLVKTVEQIELIDTDGNLKADLGDKLSLINIARGVLNDIENANTKAITLKLKNKEQEVAASTAAKDRIAAVLAAAAPGRLPDNIDVGKLEAKLEEMFGDDIAEFEMKNNHRDLSE